MKVEHIVVQVYIEIAQVRLLCSALSDQGQAHRVTLKLFPFTTIKTVKSNISALAYDRKLFCVWTHLAI